jgi:hypothetical protein
MFTIMQHHLQIGQHYVSARWTSVHEVAESSRSDKHGGFHLYNKPSLAHPSSSFCRLTARTNPNIIMFSFLSPVHTSSEHDSSEYASSEEDAGAAPRPVAQKRKLPRSFKSAGTKKFGRTAKGRKVAYQHAKQMRESGRSFQQSPSQSGHLFFARLPVKLQKEVLSHLAPRDLALIRRSCQQLHGIVKRFETDVTQRTINHHINRLQTSIDNINATQYPMDVNSFLTCMRT